MYYVKIPLRFIGQRETLNVPAEAQQKVWDERVASLLYDFRNGVIPSWAVHYKDLEKIELLGDATEDEDDG